MAYNYMRLEFAVCISLVLLLLLEYGVELLMDQSMYDLTSRPSSAYQAVVLPSLSLNNMIFKDDNEIHDRPLFSEDRKPQISNYITVEAATDVGALDSWLLIGVFTNQEKTYALFKNKNENKKYLKLSENQILDGWLIKQIKPDYVLLALSGQERILELITIKPKIKPSADYDPIVKR